MVYGSSNHNQYTVDDSEQKLLFDLRQSWANTIDYYSKMLRYYKLTYNLKGWYDTLIFMMPPIFSRIKKNKMQTIKDFKKIVSDVDNVTNQYERTYLGKDRKPEGMNKIIEALSEMELFLEEIIEKNNMYGTSTTESII